MPRVLSLDQRQYLVERYVANGMDRVLAVDDFIQKYLAIDPPSWSTPKRLYDKRKATGGVQTIPHKQPCKVNNLLSKAMAQMTYAQMTTHKID